MMSPERMIRVPAILAAILAVLPVEAPAQDAATNALRDAARAQERPADANSRPEKPHADQPIEGSNHRRHQYQTDRIWWGKNGPRF